MKRRDIIAGWRSRVLARPPKSMRLSRSIFPVPNWSRIEHFSTSSWMSIHSWISLPAHLRFALRISRCCSTGAPGKTAALRPHLSPESSKRYIRWRASRRDRIPRAGRLYFPHLVYQTGGRAHVELCCRSRERKAQTDN